MADRRMQRWLDEGRYSATVPAVRLAALAAGLGALLMAGVLAFAWGPTQREHGERTAKVQALRAEIRRMHEALRLREAYGIALNAVQDWDVKLKGGADRSAVVASVAALAQRSGVSVLGQALRDGNHPAGVRTVQQELVLEGPYPGLKAFLGGLATLPSWTEVRTGQLETSAGDAGRVRATLRLVTYREAAPEAP